jgi:hypothetical protein
MIKEADGGMKDRFGRAAYLYTGARNLSAGRAKATIAADGRRFFEGRISCVLVGNVGKVLGGVEAFTGARPDDGLLELGVVTAKNPVEWAGPSAGSPWENRRSRRSSRSPAAGRSGSGSTASSATNWTAARGPLSAR